MLYSDYQVQVMGHVPYIGFVTYCRATVRTRFTFCIKKKKKKGLSHLFSEKLLIYWGDRFCELDSSSGSNLLVSNILPGILRPLSNLYRPKKHD
jgi:hypothetical protein